jgi:hypothetical protein
MATCIWGYSRHAEKKHFHKQKRKMEQTGFLANPRSSYQYATSGLMQELQAQGYRTFGSPSAEPSVQSETPNIFQQLLASGFKPVNNAEQLNATMFAPVSEEVLLGPQQQQQQSDLPFVFALSVNEEKKFLSTDKSRLTLSNVPTEWILDPSGELKVKDADLYISGNGGITNKREEAAKLKIISQPGKRVQIIESGNSDKYVATDGRGNIQFTNITTWTPAMFLLHYIEQTEPPRSLKSVRTPEELSRLDNIIIDEALAELKATQEALAQCRKGCQSTVHQEAKKIQKQSCTIL